MCWIYLIAAILLEVFGTTMMKLSNGMSEITPTILMFLAYILCFASLSLSLKELDVSIVYAIWSAVGIICISAIGILFFHEHLSIAKVIFTLVIIIGVTGLKLSST